MRSNPIKLLSLLVVAFIFVSCSHRLSGKWNVNYETTSPGAQTVSLTNIGTMNFNSNGTGEKQLNYSVMGIQKQDNSPFTWKWEDGKYVEIKSDNSEFAKTWIVIENKRNLQRWKSTDGGSNVQIIELRK